MLTTAILLITVENDPVSFLVILLDMKYGKFKMCIFESMQYYKISTAKCFLISYFLLSVSLIHAQKILTGADQMDLYLSQLQNKKVGLFVNHTSLVGDTHLTDTLISRGVDVSVVFSPEHGFKGNKADGEKITGESSEKFELISLYGQSKRPDTAKVAALDILIVDIQDVGVRCYTYVSTMTYLMEACAQTGVPVMILDRPNPNGYVDGPMLDERFESFVGLHPVPLVHGLTLGEYAKMINGEGWLKDSLTCKLEVIPVTNWTHGTAYDIPVAPSPNLPNNLAISLYPSLVLFEGTVVSVGRGTDFPFQVIGHPDYAQGSFSFTPHPNEGSKYPPLEGEQCFGTGFLNQKPKQEFTLSYLLQYYNVLRNTSDSFFIDSFLRLAGTDALQPQIEQGLSELEIRASWEKDLNQYRTMRKKYLLYKD